MRVRIVVASVVVGLLFGNTAFGQDLTCIGFAYAPANKTVCTTADEMLRVVKDGAPTTTPGCQKMLPTEFVDIGRLDYDGKLPVDNFGSKFIVPGKLCHSPTCNTCEHVYFTLTESQ